MIELDAKRLDFNVRIKRLDVEQAFFQLLLKFPLEYLFTILGDPNNMILMVVCSVGTQFDLHAYMVSKPSNENLQPAAAGFHPWANAQGPQPDL